MDKNRLGEYRLSDNLIALLSSDFEIYSEKQVQSSPGQFVIDGKTHSTVPDLLLKPKKHLVDSNNFIDTVIPVEIKKFNYLEMNKYEDLMFQCHSYRFSIFNNVQPKLCLYFIDNYFETSESNTHLKYDYSLITNRKTADYRIWKCIEDKVRIEILFGRFGIGEIVTSLSGYTFKVKRATLFHKEGDAITFNRNVLNFWWGTNGNKKGF